MGGGLGGERDRIAYYRAVGACMCVRGRQREKRLRQMVSASRESGPENARIITGEARRDRRGGRGIICFAPHFRQKRPIQYKETNAVNGTLSNSTRGPGRRGDEHGLIAVLSAMLDR